MMITQTILSNEPTSINRKSATIICFSHIRWEELTQKSKERLKLMAKDNMLYYIEEPVYNASVESYYFHLKKEERLYVAVPHLLPGCSSEQALEVQQALLDDFMKVKKFPQYVFWYCNSEADKFSGHYTPCTIVYDSGLLKVRRSKQTNYKVDYIQSSK